MQRRKFIGTAAAGAAALSVLPMCKSGNTQEEKTETPQGPNSKFGGVQIGTITYSWRDKPSTAQDILNYCIATGISSIELMGDAIEAYAGFPPSPTELPEKLSAEQQARLDEILKMSGGISLEQFKKSVEPPVWQMVVAMLIGPTEEQVNWRKTVPMDKFEELRKMYNDAGVEIHIAKLSPAGMSEEEIEYAFKVAKTVGAGGITEEIGIDAAKKLAPYAEKHGVFAVMHNHFQFADPNFNVDEILAVSPSVMLNFDCGHYYGSTGLNPVDFINKYHNRIFSLHIKDKTGPKTDPPNENQVWGQGEVPLAEVLLLLKQHANEDGWPKYADIELEYPVKPWSDSVKEVKNCVAFARQILV